MGLADDEDVKVEGIDKAEVLEEVESLNLREAVAVAV
jgi:hypothetical protein